MTRPHPTRPGPILATIALLLAGVLPLPGGWAGSARRAARSQEMNRADRESDSGGYYEGLINGGADGDAGRELALRLLGKPPDWMSFHDVEATRYRKTDFLLFDLKPNVRRTALGQPFTTNRLGLRDREYPRDKPEGTFRIALLGSSIDMGWGVGTDHTYENLFEDWLNAHAARRGLSRRFEVLNFAVAAYGPMQRLDAFRRKAIARRPDLVIYSATLLDTRLAELHLNKLLQSGIDLKYEPLRRAAAGLTESDLRLDRDGGFRDKEAVRSKLRPRLWGLVDDTIGLLAADCRSRGIPLACLLIPRAGQSDSPEERGPGVARQSAIAARHALPTIDLTAAFDGQDPAAISIAPWDDHPNDRGHEILFLALARALVEDRDLYALLFDIASD